jgi:hypothetical protein
VYVCILHVYMEDKWSKLFEFDELIGDDDTNLNRLMLNFK